MVGEIMPDIEELLNSQGYFTCEKMHARMLVTACIGRQKKNNARSWEGSYLECKKCKQGGEIMEEQKKGQDIEVGAKRLRTCKKCEKPQDAEKDFYDKTAICKTCTKAKTKENREKRKALEIAGQESLKPKPAHIPASPFAPDKVDAEQGVPKQGVLLDFSDYPEIVEAIEVEAKKDVRTVGQQMVWILKNWEESWHKGGELNG